MKSEFEAFWNWHQELKKVSNLHWDVNALSKCTLGLKQQFISAQNIQTIRSKLQYSGLMLRVVSCGRMCLWGYDHLVSMRVYDQICMSSSSICTLLLPPISHLPQHRRKLDTFNTAAFEKLNFNLFRAPFFWICNSVFQFFK